MTIFDLYSPTVRKGDRWLNLLLISIFACDVICLPVTYVAMRVFDQFQWPVTILVLGMIAATTVSLLLRFWFRPSASKAFASLTAIVSIFLLFISFGSWVLFVPREQAAKSAAEDSMRQGALQKVFFAYEEYVSDTGTPPDGFMPLVRSGNLKLSDLTHNPALGSASGTISDQELDAIIAKNSDFIFIEPPSKTGPILLERERNSRGEFFAVDAEGKISSIDEKTVHEIIARSKSKRQ